MILNPNYLLANRHKIYIIWEDIRPALSIDGNKIHSNIRHRATVHDCINMHRLKMCELYKDISNISEEELLKEFLVENYGWIEEK